MTTHVQENNVADKDPQKNLTLTALIALQNFLGDDLQENLQAGGNKALSDIIKSLRVSLFTKSEIDSVAPSEIVAVLGSILRQAQTRYSNFPEFALQDHQDSSIHDSLEAYLDNLKNYIDTYREDFDPTMTFFDEDVALKYIKKCGIGNVKSVGLSPITDSIINIISDDNQPLTGLENINKKFAGLGNVGSVFYRNERVSFRSVEGSQIEGLDSLDNTIRGISSAWGAEYNVASGNIVSIYSKPDNYLAFTNTIGGLDLSKIDCVTTSEFDEQRRIKNIRFGEGVTGLEETGLGILSEELTKRENLTNVKSIGFSYDSNVVVVEYNDQNEAKFFPIG